MATKSTLLGTLIALGLISAGIGAGCGDSESDTRCDTDDAANDIDNSIAEEDAGMQDASSPPAVACTGSTLEEACTEYCEAFCQNQVPHCEASRCEPAECEAGGQVYDTCTSGCAAADCARDLCEDQQDIACEAFGVEVEGRFESFCLGNDPTCVVAPELGCSDVCGSSQQAAGGDFVDNGVCEDGRSDAVSAVCARGTDCTDCGPFECAPAGGACENHGDCCGFESEPGALCVDADGQGGPNSPICFANCDEDHPCPQGFRCNPTTGARDVCVSIE